MKGVMIRRSGEELGKMQGVQKNDQQVLLARQKSMELMLYRMQKGQTGCLRALPLPDNAEFYYILQGCILLQPQDGEEIMLRKGDSMVFDSTAQTTLFTILEDTEFLGFFGHPVFEDDDDNNEDLRRIMNALQEADGDTLEHCERVRQLSMRMAHKLHYPTEYMQELFYAARFHDVGKSKIPLEILIKPSALTKEEYAVMKRHSELSADMVRERFGARIAQIVLQHHERVDGTGYPQGLKGDEIRFPARLIAVADAYDAMVTVRPYNKGRTSEQALAEIDRCSGAQFDPECVMALHKALEENGTGIIIGE